MPHGKIKIGHATPHDAIGILEVFIYAWESANPRVHGDLSAKELLEMYSQESIRDKERIIQDLPESEFILTAKIQNTVIAFCRGRIEEDRNYLIGLFVLPQYQRQGIGTSLWIEAMHRFDMEKPVIVDVGVSNDMALRFYTKLGFRNGWIAPADRIAAPPELRLTFDWHPRKRDILM